MHFALEAVSPARFQQWLGERSRGAPGTGSAS
jgi:hypothetical protein